MQTSPGAEILGEARHLHVEMVGGAAGDMFLGAMLELGADPSRLSQVLDGIGPELSFESLRVARAGVAATALRVDTEDGRDALHEHHHTHPGPLFERIEGLVARGELVRDEGRLAEQIYRLLIAGEAQAHECPPDQVHLHEVGEADSFFDVVGFSSACGGRLPASVSHSPVPAGSGEVSTSHGMLAVPVPAVRAIFEEADVRMHQGQARGECVTPTGAAILVALQARQEEGNSVVARLGAPHRIGRGAGQRDPAQYPNVLELWVWD